MGTSLSLLIYFLILLWVGQLIRFVWFYLKIPMVKNKTNDLLHYRGVIPGILTIPLIYAIFIQWWNKGLWTLSIFIILMLLCILYYWRWVKFYKSTKK